MFPEFFLPLCAHQLLKINSYVNSKNQETIWISRLRPFSSLRPSRNLIFLGVEQSFQIVLACSLRIFQGTQYIIRGTSEFCGPRLKTLIWMVPSF